MTVRSTVISELEAHRIEPAGFLIAVSGGADSMALLDVFLSLPNIRFVAAHFNHKLRSDSAEDLKFISEFCLARDIKLVSGTPSGEVPENNIESWARRERYAFLKAKRKELGLGFIVTAHNSDDLVELFMMRLLANKALRTMRTLEPEECLFRPMLSVSKSEIVEYCTKSALAFREDCSNQDDRFVRNRIRNRLLPEIRQLFGPECDRIILDQALAVDRDLRLIDQGVLSDLNLKVCSEWGSRQWLQEVRALLRDAPEELRWRYLEELLLTVVKFRIGRKHGERLVDFALGNAPSIELPARIELRRSAGGLVLYRDGSQAL